MNLTRAILIGYKVQARCEAQLFKVVVLARNDESRNRNVDFSSIPASFALTWQRVFSSLRDPLTAFSGGKQSRKFRS
jgi:hypothetical protein